MSLSDIGALNQKQAAMLEFDEWTVEKLAVATVKKLTEYIGIGKITATGTIAEAIEILNERGLDEAKDLALEHHYQKASRATRATILKHWEDSGLPIKAVALSSARALAALKGIDETLALQLISNAQGIVNKRGLSQSRIVAPGSPLRQTSAAFDERWLSGEVEAPPMSIRVRRNFEEAKKEYRAANG
jgi:hypothetical protein